VGSTFCTEAHLATDTDKWGQVQSAATLAGLVNKVD
jgi:hypothetical protein